MSLFSQIYFLALIRSILHVRVSVSYIKIKRVTKNFTWRVIHTFQFLSLFLKKVLLEKWLKNVDEASFSLNFKERLNHCWWWFKGRFKVLCIVTFPIRSVPIQLIKYKKFDTQNKCNMRHNWKNQLPSWQPELTGQLSRIITVTSNFHGLSL